MKKRLLITGIAVIVILATVFALTACNDTLSDGIFSGGSIAVRNEDGRWGYVDSNGEEVLGFDYASATNFVNGVAVVSYTDSSESDPGAAEPDPGAFYLIDQEGTHLAGPFVSTTRVFDDTMIVVKDKKTNKFGVYDTAAKAFAYECAYENITPVGETSVVRMVSQISGKNGVEYVDLATGTVTMARKALNDEFTVSVVGGHNFYFYNTNTTENGKPVFKGVSVLTGAEAVTWNGRKSESSDWTYLIDDTYDADGSVTASTYHYVTETAIIALDKAVEVPQNQYDGSMLLTAKTAQGADGTNTTTYTLYGKDGAVIYSGTEQLFWNGEAYYMTKTENGTFTLNVYKDGAAYSASAAVPEGASDLNYSWNVTTEENAIDMSISYSVTTGEGESAVTENVAKQFVSIGGATTEVPEGYELKKVCGGKLVLAAENGRMGVFNADGTAVTECIYSNAQVVDGGYILVTMGNAVGVLAPDGSVVLDCVFSGISHKEGIWQSVNY